MRVYGIVGWKNSGKTGLMERLLVEITRRGFTVSTIKHAHHTFDVDHPGKDSYRHRLAGATEVLLSSQSRFALMHELRHQDELHLDALLKKLSPVDLILVEGYKDHAFSKIETHRAVTNNSLIALNDHSIRAIASDVDISTDYPVFDLDDTCSIASFILKEVGLIKFDTIVMVDWSAAKDRGPKPKKDAIWAAVANGEKVDDPQYFRNRQATEYWLQELVASEIKNKRRLCVGFDFPFGYPIGFTKALTGSKNTASVWQWFEKKVIDSPKNNNRFETAGEINRKIGNGKGPFWGILPSTKHVDGLSKNKENYSNPFFERRMVEQVVKSAFTCWQLTGIGAVGSQAIMGFPTLYRLREQFQPHVAIWPFDNTKDKPIVFAEIYPSFIVKEQTPTGWYEDEWQVFKCAEYFGSMSSDQWSELLDCTKLEPSIRDSILEEGWILGVELPTQKKSTVRNDYFALPEGIDWTPVDDVLASLQSSLSPIDQFEINKLDQSVGRVIAKPIVAKRSHPPHPNSAVDGYGLCGPIQEGKHSIPVIAARIAAGQHYKGSVPKGHAVRILTGATLPSGVNTVILDEDVRKHGMSISFLGPIKKGANTRNAGEDTIEGNITLETGRCLTAADLALASSIGVSEVCLFKPLRVAILSTGSELVQVGSTAKLHQTYDANRPMLLAMMTKFGFQTIDCGCIPDNRSKLREVLDSAANQAHLILTTGGASVGDEDHVSAILKEHGALKEWRIAVKPGRPLAFGKWNGIPLFGLPGNPVAAMVCTLIFALPAMKFISGQSWHAPQGFNVPAAFHKNKKAGRREFLRARIRNGNAEVFRSEGSGRISGLSWAEGLVELGDHAQEINHGDFVRYIPFSSFGLQMS